VVVALHPDVARATLGDADHAVMAPLVRPAGAEHLGVLVATGHDGRVRPADVAADQVARNALGLELTERAVLRPVQVPRNRLADVLLGRPAYVTCRVQPADLTTVERPVCLLDTLTVGLLGITSGDEVVVEGFDTGGSEVIQSCRLRGHEAPGPVMERRTALSGGSFESRFPSASDALGVHPDLPWIFLDSATRKSLGVHGKLGTVRIRASRRFQLLRELRESLLLALLALVGLAQVISHTAILIALTLVVLVLSAVAVVVRLRNRLAGSGSASG
jgi:hypothetical protein